MLVLSREIGESVVIGEPPNQITVTFLGLWRNGDARIGIDAPKVVRIVREEIAHRYKTQPPPAEAATDVDPNER